MGRVPDELCATSCPPGGKRAQCGNGGRVECGGDGGRVEWEWVEVMLKGVEPTLSVGSEGALRAPSHPELPVTCGPWAPAACWCLGSQGLSPSPCALGEHFPILCNCMASTTSPRDPARPVRWRLEGSRLISKRLPLPGAPHPQVKPPEPLSPGPLPSPTFPPQPSKPSGLQHPRPGLYSQCLCCFLILFQTKTKDPARGEVFICFAFLLRL